MNENADLQTILDRLAAGEHSEADIETLRQALARGDLTLATGERAVAVGGDATDAVFVTGDGSVVRVFKGPRVEVIRQVFLEVLDQAAVYRDRPPAPGDPPYKGLRYFDESDAALFFGREWLTARLAGHLRQHRLLVVVGASGSGKSSLVRAGLLPALRQGEALVDGTMPPEGSKAWSIEVITPTGRPLRVLAAATGSHPLPGSPLPAEAGENVERSKAGNSEPHLLVVDQFEELFTLCRDEAERREFVDRLLGLVEEEIPTYLIIVLRADFYTHCMAFANLREVLPEYQINIGPMSQDELRCAIEEPARRGDWDLEPGLTDLLLRDVGSEPGALPLLSHALLETWKQRRGRTMTLQGYRESGGVHGAIARTAERVYGQLSPKQQDTARHIFLQLTELGEDTPDTRRQAALAELAPTPERRAHVEGVLQELVAARLVTMEQNLAEVAHEALIREWPRLRGWLSENREFRIWQERLRGAMRSWQDSGRDKGALLPGVPLAQAREWLAQRGDEVEEDLQIFIQASFDYAENEREKNELLQRIALARKLVGQGQSGFNFTTKGPFIGIVLGIESLCLIPSLEANQLILRGLALLPRLLAQMRHKGVVRGVMFSPDGQWVVSGSEDRRVRVWDAFTGKELSQMQHNGVVLSVAFSPNSQWVVSGSEDNTARVWDVATGKELIRLRHDCGVSVVAFSPDGHQVVTGSWDGTVQVWNVVTEKQPTQMQHNRAVLSAGFSPDGRWVISGSKDSTARVWDVNENRELVCLQHGAPVSAVAFSPDGQRVVSGSQDGTARVWDVETGDQLNQLEHDGIVLAVAFSPDGRWVVSGSADGAARVWKVGTGDLLNRLEHDGGVTTVAFSPDSQCLVSGSKDGTARVWNVATGQELARMKHDNIVVAVALSPNGRWVVSGSWDGIVQVWESDPKQELARMEHKERVSAVAFSPNGQRVVSGSWDGPARVWDAETGQELVRIQHGYGIRAVAFSPNGRQVLSGGTDNTVRVWDAETGKVTLCLQHSGSVSTAAFSPEGCLVISRSGDNTARVWDITTGRELLRLLHNGPIWAVVFSPNGHWVASGGLDGTARVWEIATQKERARMQHNSEVKAVDFSPDSCRVISGSADGRVRVWEVSSGQEVVQMRHDDQVETVLFSPDGCWVLSRSLTTVQVWKIGTGKETARIQHDGRINAVSFSPDGQWVLSGSSDNTMRVWETTTGQEVARMQHDDDVTSVAFSPDGRRILSGSTDGTARVWLWQPEDLIAEACRRLPRNLTHEEWEQYIGPDIPYHATCPNLPVPGE